MGIKQVTYNSRRNLASGKVREKYKTWISPTIITRALTGFKKKESQGLDSIQHLLFDHLPQKFIDTLELIYKGAIHLGYAPKLWKKTKVILISKPGKDSLTDQNVSGRSLFQTTSSRIWNGLRPGSWIWPYSHIPSIISSMPMNEEIYGITRLRPLSKRWPVSLSWSWLPFGSICRWFPRIMGQIKYRFTKKAWFPVWAKHGECYIKQDRLYWKIHHEKATLYWRISRHQLGL